MALGTYPALSSSAVEDNHRKTFLHKLLGLTGQLGLKPPRLRPQTLFQFDYKLAVNSHQALQIATQPQHQIPLPSPSIKGRQ